MDDARCCCDASYCRVVHPELVVLVSSSTLTHAVLEIERISIWMGCEVSRTSCAQASETCQTKRLLLKWVVLVSSSTLTYAALEIERI